MGSGAVGIPRPCQGVARCRHDYERSPYSGHQVETNLSGLTQAVSIPAAGLTLAGDLMLPARPRGLVAFAHGSGSSRFSPRNRYVANVLHAAGLATLLFDLLTQQEAAEEATGHAPRFDIPLLQKRLLAAIDWCVQQPQLEALPWACSVPALVRQRLWRLPLPGPSWCRPSWPVEAVRTWPLTPSPWCTARRC